MTKLYQISNFSEVSKMNKIKSLFSKGVNKIKNAFSYAETTVNVRAHQVLDGMMRWVGLMNNSFNPHFSSYVTQSSSDTNMF